MAPADDIQSPLSDPKAGAAGADDSGAEAEAPPEARQGNWHSPGIVLTVMLAVMAIAGAGLYILLTDVGGLAAASALPAVAGAMTPGLAGLIYALFLGRRVRQARLLAAVFEDSAALRAVLDSDLRPIATNAAYRRVFAADAAPLVALAERVAGDKGARAGLGRVRRAAEKGQAARADLALDGGAIWYRVALAPTRDRAGRMLFSAEDVTAERVAERALKEDIATFMASVETAPVGVYSVDSGGYFRFVNGTLASWLGADAKNLTSGGGQLHDFLAEPAPKGTPAHDPLGGGARTGAVTLVARDGRHLRVLVSQRADPPRDDMSHATWAVVCDLSAVGAGEQPIQGAPHLFEKIFANAPIGIAVLDLDGRMADCNAAFCEIAGVAHDDVVGQPLAGMIAEGERAEVIASIKDVAGGGEPKTPFEARPEALPDAVLSFYLSLLAEPGGEATGLMVQILDTTEQRNLEIQFAQSQKMQAVGPLAGGIAHDFNNLLTAMIGFCDLLLLRHRPGEESFADIMQIKQNANRAANLVRQLLAFSRQQTLEPKVLDITDVLAELTHLLRRLIGENIELKVVHGRDLGPVRVDQGQFEQVIINLVVNARDAMVEGGTLTIKTSNVTPDDPIRRGHALMPAGDYTLTEVIDTGEGISKENLGRIFEPFYTTKEIGAGTGLGLSTVYGIVKQTGGFIFVDSAPGKGAKFSIFIPRHDGDGTEVAKRPAVEPEDRRDLTGAGTVLLVEDEDAVRMFGARALKNKGYNVMEAVSGEDALAIIKECADEIDLLITDVVMPNMDGPALIREVREIRPDMKVICISGYAEDAFRKRVDRGADIHFLPKPFSLQQLAGKVKDVMQAPRE